MIDRKKVIEGFECCSVKQSCSGCPWMGLDCNDRLHLAALELLKEQGKRFSPIEVCLAMVKHGQSDNRFKWGETIRYSPSEVEEILNNLVNEVEQDG